MIKTHLLTFILLLIVHFNAQAEQIPRCLLNEFSLFQKDDLKTMPEKEVMNTSSKENKKECWNTGGTFHVFICH
ncbi:MULTISPECIES: hypothetical protein [Candidatus Williamhamiltonella]|uniref:Uncharacterized protein n=1 Tax=Candidatus Williamhamiltonella defendens TaxID=138072 RepID=A0A2D3TB95_9ENTR|nr:hypothetical protein [Candidatus Hamiltonella defensa]ATW33058.1 hypothetical protein BJP43_00835 [Candidatus Hamiltonella defensa]AYB49146.1 hypothetical protein CJJ19_06160 [Candidatus Hamiltonella defensa]